MQFIIHILRVIVVDICVVIWLSFCSNKLFDLLCIALLNLMREVLLESQELLLFKTKTTFYEFNR